MSAVVTPTETSTLPHISLYYKEGTSDKEYHLAILGCEEKGFQLQYRYGRRGSTMKAKFKNPVPTDYATVKALYDSKLAEQLSEGYTPNEDGTPYQATDQAGKVSGVLPQLLNFITEEEALALIEDDGWVMEEKKDGIRIQTIKKGKEVIGSNKKGLITPLPIPVADAIAKACGEANATLDGELIADVYWLFDLLAIGIHAYATKTVRERLEGIQEWLFDGLNEHLKLVPVAVGKASKRALWKRLKAENAEGVVFKKLDSVYKAGRPNSGGNQLKFKFTAEATVRVRAMNGDKASFQMEVLDKGNWSYVGDCTYYPTKFTPKPGQIVVVRYLYVKGEGGCLFQPILEEDNPRKDLSEGDCVKSQLKYKQGSVEDDDQ